MSLKKRIKSLMETNPYCKDNDFSLCSEIWNEDCQKLGLVLSEISALTFMSLMTTGEISKQQTIQRVRRDLNFKEPQTIGASYKSNLKKKPKIKKVVKKIVFNKKKKQAIKVKHKIHTIRERKELIDKSLEAKDAKILKDNGIELVSPFRKPISNSRFMVEKTSRFS